MAQLSDIRDFVREQTLIETDDWSNAKVDNVINEGIYEVSSRFRWPFLAQTGTLDVTANQQSYPLTDIASDIARIEAVVETGARRRLTELSAPEALHMWGDDMPSSSSATRFFIWGTSVYLIPIPDANETGAYTFFYYKQPTLLTNDTDTPEWDVQFHMSLAFYTIAKVWEREEDLEKSSYWQQRFDQRVEQMASYYLNRASDHPSIVGGGHHLRTPRANMPFLDGA